MVGSQAASAVFDFENILPQLDFLPIAARRALDHAGLRLSLEAWRSLGLEDRCQLVAAGADDLVDAGTVAQVVRRATPPAQRIEVVGDPDPLAPPDGLMRLIEPVPLDARQWARLRALDRYALAHVHRRSIARNDPTLLQAAYEDIVMGHLRSLRPGAGDVGRSSSPPPPVVPPPPPLPRSDGAPRFPRAHDAGPDRYDATPAPGRADTTPIRGPAYDTPAPSARGRPYDAPTPGRGPAFDTPPSGQTYGLGRSARGPESATLGRMHDTSGPGRAYEGRPAPRPPETHDAFDPEGDIPGLTPLAPDVLSTHLTASGDAHMIDVGHKPATDRRAVAAAIVHMRRDTFRRLAQHDTPKGDVLAAARIAGIQAAKRTSELIPLCHIVALTSVEVHLELDAAAHCVHVTATARAHDRTGVEMEALVAATIASLTLYDMLKGIDRDMIVSDVKLLEKSGGRTGHYQRRDP